MKVCDVAKRAGAQSSRWRGRAPSGGWRRAGPRAPARSGRRAARNRSRTCDTSRQADGLAAISARTAARPGQRASRQTTPAARSAAGGAYPKCRYAGARGTCVRAASVAGIRSARGTARRLPRSCPRSSPTAAAIVPIPTGPPSNFSMIVRRMRESMSSARAGRRRASGARCSATLWLIMPSARTCAKSRTRRSRRLATRACRASVAAISAVPPASIATLSTSAVRRTIVSRSGDRIVVQALLDPEPRAQRRRQHAETGGRADEREPLDRHRDGLRLRPVRQADLDLEVLHRRIEEFLDDRPQAMDLVDEQDVAGAEIGQRADEIARLLERRTGLGVDVDADLTGDQLAERRLAQARRAEEQRVIERLAAADAPRRCRSAANL